MKFLLLVHIALLLLTTFVFAQDPEIQKLNQNIATLYQQGKFDDAIPLAEKVVAIEKKASKNSIGHAFALTNLAQLNKEKAKAIRANIAKFEPRNRSGAISESKASAERAKQFYREALDIHQSSKSENSPPAIAVKNELAWTVYNFIVSDSIGESRAQIDEAEKLYTEALAASDGLAPPDVDLQLLTLNNFGDFYMKFVNFEKALPLYERSIKAGEAKYGGKSSQLLGGLRGLFEIYSITGQDAEMRSSKAKIEAISGTAETTPKYRDLTARSRGIAKVDAIGFIHTDLTDLDRSFKTSAEIQRMLTPPGQYIVRSIEVELLVNEDGTVAEAKVMTPSKYTKQVEEAAMASKFRPFEYNGKRQKLKGKIYFNYKD